MNTAQQPAQQPIKPETYTLQYAAKSLAIGELRLFKMLRQHHIIYRDEHGNNLPYQQYINNKYFCVKTTSWHHPTTGTHLRASIKITEKGINWLAKRLPHWRLNNVQH